MSFQGSLDTIGLADVFQLFAFSRKSGALHIRNSDRHGVVYFVDGEVYYATTAPLEGIGNMLVKAGLVPPEQWKQVISSAAAGTGQGELLLSADGVDSGAIEAFVQEHVEDAIFKLSRWNSGLFQLEDEIHPFGPSFRFGCDPLLAEAERRVEIWDAVTGLIPSTSMGVALVRDVVADDGGVVLTRAEWRLLSTLTAGVSISELSAALGETEFRTVQTLHGLVERGLVELVSEERLTAVRGLVGGEYGLFETHLDAVDLADVDRAGSDDDGVDDGAEPEGMPDRNDIPPEDGPNATPTVDAATVEAATEDAPTGTEPEISADDDSDAFEELADQSDPDVPVRVSIADLAARADDDTSDPGIAEPVGDELRYEGYADDAGIATYSTAPEVQDHVSVPGVANESYYDNDGASLTGTDVYGRDDHVDTLQNESPGYELGNRYETVPVPETETGFDEIAAAPSVSEEPSDPGEPPPAHADVPADTDAATSATSGEDLDKSLILRLIAGVRSL